MPYHDRPITWDKSLTFSLFLHPIDKTVVSENRRFRFFRTDAWPIPSTTNWMYLLTIFRRSRAGLRYHRLHSVFLDERDVKAIWRQRRPDNDHDECMQVVQ